MKFRNKSIINCSIIIWFILLILGLFIDLDILILYIFIWFIVIFLIAFVFRYQNYIELDDISITQTKYNILLKKTITTIQYKEIINIQLGTNHTLSSLDVWEEKHHIESTSWKSIEIWKIFHFKEFKNTLEEKKYLMAMSTWEIGWEKWEIFTFREGWYLKLWDKEMFISKDHNWTHKTLSIQYPDIEQIEIVILSEFSDNDWCFYTKIKNQKLKEAFYGLNNCNSFLDSLKKKWINAKLVPSDEIISDLKEEDLY